MEKHAGGDGEKAKAPADKYSEISDEAFPAPPIAPDGGIAPGWGGIDLPSGAPPATPQNMICLRGPCRHYWELVTTSPAGNPSDTWAELGQREPRQINRTCIVNPGYETELTEDCAYDCNLWDPLREAEVTLREQRREAYFTKHPDHRPLEEQLDDSELLDQEDKDGTTGTEG
jgi:hypothetical protein